MTTENNKIKEPDGPFYICDVCTDVGHDHNAKWPDELIYWPGQDKVSKMKFDRKLIKDELETDDISEVYNEMPEGESWVCSDCYCEYGPGDYLKEKLMGLPEYLRNKN